MKNIFSPGGGRPHLVCRNKTVDGHFEIKCDATNGGGEILSVVMEFPQEIQQPTQPQVNCSHSNTESGVSIECFSSHQSITGMAYFINGAPTGVVRKDDTMCLFI